MIDTLARHIAALQEARRLIRMVLANNPAFGAISRLETGSREMAGLASADLFANDANFRAYCHLTDALAALATSMSLPEVQPSDSTPRPLDRIDVLQPCVQANARTVLAARDVAYTPPVAPPPMEESWVQVRDEARVAILRR